MVSGAEGGVEPPGVNATRPEHWDFAGKPLKELSGTPAQVAAQLKALLAAR